MESNEAILLADREAPGKAFEALRKLIIEKAELKAVIAVPL
jgi:hypothetical protein